MPRRDPASQRLRTFIENEKRSKDFARQFAGIRGVGLLGQLVEKEERWNRIDWSDLTKRSLGANRALSLNKSDTVLKKAFDAFGLNAQNPFDWRKLIDYFARAHFETQRRGAPKKWTTESYAQFLKDAGKTIKRQLCRSHRELWERMKADRSFGGRYKIKYETFRKTLREAMKWGISVRARRQKLGSTVPPKLLGN